MKQEAKKKLERNEKRKIKKNVNLIFSHVNPTFLSIEPSNWTLLINKYPQIIMRVLVQVENGGKLVWK
jgi:hypothetical protein